ncbi:MAG: 50S ribosomal protein L6, partial [Candidatus Omnitrophota bacterium]
MSRVGKKPIQIIKGVKVNVNGNTVLVEGPKGKLSQSFLPSMKIEVNGEQIIVSPDAEKATKNAGAIHGLTRSLINNMIIGVTSGYQKELEIQGVGFRAQVTGK